MLDKLLRFLIKKLYKTLIYRTIILNKQSSEQYASLPFFCSVNIPTTKGFFNFLFKKDRRNRTGKEVKFPKLSSYIVQLEPPKALGVENETITNVVIVIIIITLFKINYKILVEVLADNYLDSILEKAINNKGLSRF